MQLAEPKERLVLAAHVRACENDGQVILLDLRTGKYLGIRRSPELAEQVEGWPGHSPLAHRRPPSPEVESLIGRLQSRDLLASARPERSAHATLQNPVASVDPQRDSLEASGGIRHMGRLVGAAAAAAIALRCRSLLEIATAVEMRRPAAQRHGADVRMTDAMSDDVVIYERLRPFVFTAHRSCLHDSLALVGFLAADHLFPHWVIGVQTRPFGAHSWVQCGSTVLNDEPERVRRFSPILIV